MADFISKEKPEPAPVPKHQPGESIVGYSIVHGTVLVTCSYCGGERQLRRLRGRQIVKCGNCHGTGKERIYVDKPVRISGYIDEIRITRRNGAFHGPYRISYRLGTTVSQRNYRYVDEEHIVPYRESFRRGRTLMVEFRKKLKEEIAEHERKAKLIPKPAKKHSNWY